MKIEINAALREKQGTGPSRRLRRAARVPAILYGAAKTAQSIELDHNELFHKLKLEAFHASILNMKLNRADEQVLLRDVQMHPFRPIVLHADFQRVAAHIKINMRVPLHFVNDDIAPGVKLTGGIVSHVINEVEVTCLPADLPEFIQVDLAALAAGHTLHLADVKKPRGVEFTALVKHENPPVATIIIPRAAPVEDEAVAIAAPAAADVPAVNQPAKADEKEGKEKDKKK